DPTVCSTPVTTCQSRRTRATHGLAGPLATLSRAAVTTLLLSARMLTARRHHVSECSCSCSGGGASGIGSSHRGRLAADVPVAAVARTVATSVTNTCRANVADD